MSPEAWDGGYGFRAHELLTRGHKGGCARDIEQQLWSARSQHQHSTTGQINFPKRNAGQSLEVTRNSKIRPYRHAHPTDVQLPVRPAGAQAADRLEIGFTMRA